MGTAVIAGGNAAPVLQLGEEVLNLMAQLVKPLAGREPLVAVPPGGDAGSDALLQQHGADLVAVVPLVSNQGSCLWQIPQQVVRPVESLHCPSLR